jgi:hypothetical protein
MAAGLLLAGALAAVIWTLSRAVWPRAGSPDPLDVMLALALLVDVAAFTLTDRPYDLMSGRYLMPAVISGLILAARSAARMPRIATGGVVASAGAVLLVHAAVAPALFGAAPAPEPTAALADWLVAHDMKRGYAPYWEANLMTVESKGRVQVLPVAGQGDTIASYHYLSREDWYTDSSRDGGSRFIVIRDVAGDPARPDPSVNFGLSEDLAIRTFGPPAEVVSIQHYTILCWDSDIAARVVR